MSIFSTLLLVALLGGGFYFTYWAINRTLADSSGQGRNQRRKARKK
ncbi:MAG: hypothetical protein OHK0039_32550 [Bacteroidia bacterium]